VKRFVRKYVRRYVPEGLREWLGLLPRSRRALISAGLFLVAVPTLFQVFPSWTHWPLWIRIAVAVVWALVAAFVVHSSVRQGERVDNLVGRTRERRDEQRMLARNRLLRLLLEHETGLPENYQWRIFMYDEETDLLVASYAPEGAASATSWEIGKGAVGHAFETNEHVLVRGPACSDGTYGLTPEQQERYQELHVVAAMPLRNPYGDPFAVLAGSSTNDDGQLATPDGHRRHVELATIVQRVLIDLLTDAG
jgi:hypothetical protein